MMEGREEKEKTGGEKGKWSNRGLSELVLGQNGRGRWMTVRWKKEMKKTKIKIKINENINDVKYQFDECSGLFPLISVSGGNTFI
jgi:hypothetical protein